MRYLFMSAVKAFNPVYLQSGRIDASHRSDLLLLIDWKRDILHVIKRALQLDAKIAELNLR